uniref:C2H2-type domain-containing protein n=1 Tax=Macrostomum lignano TaxID=282301 RepID=A0A1I8JQJ5_9PLAT
LCFNKQDLLLHNSSVHKADPRPFHCDTCGRQFSTSATSASIVEFTAARSRTAATRENPHRRQALPLLAVRQEFHQMSNLQSHQRQHMKDKPHRCEACYMCFDSKDELDTHAAAKHSTNRLRWCGVSAAWYSKVLVCRVCGKNYNSETYLNKHLAKHKDPTQGSVTDRLQVGGLVFAKV